MDFPSRYLVRGFVDGALSTLGVVIGASTAIGTSADATAIIIAAGIGGGVSNGLSNILGAFMAEKVVAGERLEEMEKAMLKEEALRGTKVDEEFHDKTISGGISDGLATMGGALIPVFPFMLVPIVAISEMSALLSSIIVSLFLFAGLGVYIGRVSKENIYYSILKMTAFAGLTAIIATIIRILL
ncbi:hypothetical protein AKJ52_01925 [candidate division MSBL1 archaeon SCGC-AAA382C18]|uniref:TIGR00267 family protein n=1 Tax=candidate division MSBL1 archaeon SCGC-AAA382C18 TaxID=1698281 RepID=A0A133VJL3_9EURY|nr:hypothetical protein AKJ52_01925 [candidate division MSBL1 archaeon SCGC-AAA382C18]